MTHRSFVPQLKRGGLMLWILLTPKNLRVRLSCGFYNRELGAALS